MISSITLFSHFDGIAIMKMETNFIEEISNTFCIYHKLPYLYFIYYTRYTHLILRSKFYFH